MEYYTERISKNNFSDFLAIFQSEFNLQEIDKSNFENKFDTHYSSASFVGYIAYHNSIKAPAAYYGVFPTMVQEMIKPIWLHNLAILPRILSTEEKVYSECFMTKPCSYAEKKE